MSARLRIVLLVGCFGLALLYGPSSGPLLAKGLRGPYVEPQPAPANDRPASDVEAAIGPVRPVGPAGHRSPRSKPCSTGVGGAVSTARPPSSRSRWNPRPVRPAERA